MKIKVIGIGNILCGDDGLGVLAVKILDRELKDHVKCVCGETDLYFSLEEALDADFLIIVDAILGGGEPGTVYVTDLSGSNHLPLSAHGINLLSLLTMMQRTGKSVNGVLVGMEPLNLEAGSKISREVKENIPHLCREVKKIIQPFLK